MLKIRQPLRAWLILAPPDEIISEVRKRIRAALGDKIGTETIVTARNGYYFIGFPPSLRNQQLMTWTAKSFRRRNLEAFFKELASYRRRKTRAINSTSKL